MLRAPSALRLLAVFCALALGGCVDVRIFQSENEAVVRIGTTPVPGETPVADYIGDYTPYAILAARAYENLDHGRLDDTTTFVAMDGRSWKAEARAWLKPWRFAFAEVGPLCTDGVCGVPGLVFHVWTRRAGASCDEAAIAFRGTDSGSLGDWLSNFHGITRLLPVHDQYDQLQVNMDRIVAHVRRLPCVTAKTRIVAVGHSLGGGLAQQAAYMSPQIQRVYAFDPSPVTGWEDPDTRYPQRPWPLVTDRVYEHGEILAYVRFVLRQFIPQSDCDPRIRSFRVAIIHGNPIFQHSMDELAAGFLERSGRPYDPAHARPLPGSSPDEGLACRGPIGNTPAIAAR